MAELTDKYIRFDWAIKRLLRQKANFDVLEGFLTVFIGEPLHIVEILESESNQTQEYDKYNRVDIKARNSKGEIILIEVQNSREADYLERILYGVAKAITEHLALGPPYREVKKVYSISIIYFDLGKGTDYLYHGQNRFVGVHTHDSLQITRKEQDALVGRRPEEIFPEYILIRVNEFNQGAIAPLEEWMAYLKDGVIRPDTKAPGLHEAREKLQYYAMDNQERKAYEAHLEAIVVHNDVINTAKREGRWEGREEGLAEGRVEGMEKGLVKGKIEMARNLKSLGVDVKTIMQASGLTEEQIEQL